MTSFSALGITVADMGRALEFYRLLGLDIPPEADGEGHVDVELPGGLRLMFDTEDVIRSFEPDWEAPASEGRISLAFQCESPAAVDHTFDVLISAGFPAHAMPFDAFWGQRYATVRDPDGNRIDLFAPVPQDE